MRGMATTKPEPHAEPPPERATAPPSAWQRGACIHGRFKIERKLGSGGMGEVYEALDLKLQRQVAIKVWRRPIGNAEAEATILAQLDHPNILTIHEYVSGDPALLVTALARGTPLDRYLATRRRLSPDEFFAVAGQIAAGLAACHKGGIQHRDLKPGNIILDEADDGIHVKLIDFGIAALRRHHERDTSTFKVSPVDSGEVWGSRLYMAPEQWDGAPSSNAADVYGLGCVLHELITGVPPFADDKYLQQQHREGPRPVPSRRCAWVPPALDALIADMLAPEAARRPVDARAVVRRLELAAQQPRRRRRRWPAALVAGATLVACFAVLINSTAGHPSQVAAPQVEQPADAPPSIADEPAPAQPSPPTEPAIDAVYGPPEPTEPIAPGKRRKGKPKEPSPIVDPLPPPPPVVIPADVAEIRRNVERVLPEDGRVTIAFGADRSFEFVKDQSNLTPAAEAVLNKALKRVLGKYTESPAELTLRCVNRKCT